MVKYVIVTGGVISGVGKGIATASIGKILQEYGYKVTAVKIDPYINVDASLLSPKEHGETWVTSDGGEIDQDIGNYERFLNIELSRANGITTGQIYKSVIDKERAGYYEGKTVQFIPHITGEIKERLINVAKNNDIVLVEVGGVVGDYENIPFLSAIKSLEHEIGKENMLYILVTFMPVPSHIKEMKTKPTQTAIRELMQCGITPDIILCRGEDALDGPRKNKIETYVHINKDHVISAADTDSIYKVPLNLESEHIGEKILKILHLDKKKTPDWKLWTTLISNMENYDKKIKIGIVGKYLKIGDYQLTDVYLSVSEALKHASAHLSVSIDIEWIDSTEITENNVKMLSKFNGVVIPGGFGSNGVEGKILAIKYVRENDIPYLGLCYGMQLAVVEYARTVCGLDAHTTEVNKDTPNPVVSLMETQKDIKQLGGTLRLGAYPCIITHGSVVYKLYDKLGKIINKGLIYERHRHRYEINPKYVDVLKESGLIFSGYYLDTKNNTSLMEYLELPNKKFFVATQAHPEFTSNLLNPNPLFYGFVEACIN